MQSHKDRDFKTHFLALPGIYFSRLPGMETMHTVWNQGPSGYEFQLSGEVSMGTIRVEAIPGMRID